MRKTVFILGSIALCAAVIYALIPSGEDAALRLDQAEVQEAKQIDREEVAGDSVAIPLSSTNTKIGFSCAKTVGGKILTVRGGWSKAFGSKISGQILTGRDNQEVLGIDLQIDVGSLWSEHDQLTEALLTKGFFRVAEHPQATFTSANIEIASDLEAAGADATHQIEGNFSLNGIKKLIAAPVRIEWLESRVKLRSRFSLRRKDFDVSFTDTAGFGLLTDQNISELVAIDLEIDAAATPSPETSRDDVVETDQERHLSQIDPSTLPKSFTETIPATQIQFDMVLVPGDADRGTPPLYVGRHEVTWDEFMPWVDGRDLENIDGLGELRAMKLRPSPPYGSVDRGFGMDGRPALGMSRLSAHQYCQWLSRQTGSNYRLPTEEEWESAFAAGGGSLESPPVSDVADKTAVYADNSWNDDIEDWSSSLVGSMQPNTLEIFDMSGNVCEWITATGEERVARGGHFDSDREKLGVGRHIEGPYWNRDYPNEPKSIWWFVNARWVGFRVVCSPEDLSNVHATRLPLDSSGDSSTR